MTFIRSLLIVVVLLAAFSLVARAQLLCGSGQTCLARGDSCNVLRTNNATSDSCVSVLNCCVSGACTGSCVADNAGASCTDSDQCFSFTSSITCLIPETASSGECVIQNGNGSPCESGDDCLSGVCDGRGSKKRCSALTAGQECNPDNQACEMGLYCDEFSNPPVCRPRLANGASCQYHDPDDWAFTDILDLVDLVLPSQCESGYCKPAQQASAAGTNGTCSTPLTEPATANCVSVVDCQLPRICSVVPNFVDGEMEFGACSTFSLARGDCGTDNASIPEQTGGFVSDVRCPGFDRRPLSQVQTCGCSYQEAQPAGRCLPGNDFAMVSMCLQETLALRDCAVRRGCVHMFSFEKGSCMNPPCANQYAAWSRCILTATGVSPECVEETAGFVENFDGDRNNWEKAGDWFLVKSGGVPHWGWVVIGVCLICCLVIPVIVLIIALGVWLGWNR